MPASRARARRSGVEVGLGRPGAFGQVDAVVFQQRTLAEVNLHDRLVVVDQRAVVGGFGVGAAALGFEQQVEGDGVGLVGGLHGLDFVARPRRGG